jgi:hypothetical protein
MYKLYKFQDEVIGSYKETEQVRICFTFKDPANTDYAEFKKSVAEGAELQDADGNVMSAEAAQEFIRGLP